MIDLTAPLLAIEKLLPAAVEIAAGTLPQLDTALQVATAIGANPNALVGARDTLLQNHGQFESIIGAALPEISLATSDLLGIGQNFLRQALGILPRLLSPVPGSQATAIAELSTLALLSVQEASSRADRLRADLAPAVAKLDGVASEPLPELPPEVPVALSGPAPTSAAGSAQGQSAVQAAMTQLGTPYVWGGTTPDGGFDCSGFTQWAWRQAGVEIPRIAEDQTVGRPVAHEELQAGDLVVWDGHVAMYDGKGHIIEAGDPVSRNPLRQTNMGMAFKGYYRPTG
ncbi:C40 family peptidase [Corynebacterium sp. H127]|uniref:C40 family peptidase n=1 Tax=Corynebacterium sp. H127 TaxID=3133418 RepID=UPI0030A3ED94